MLIDTHCHLNDEKLLCDIDRIVGDFDKDRVVPSDERTIRTMPRARK